LELKLAFGLPDGPNAIEGDITDDIILGIGT
jgi:hypothetical protein